MEPRTAHLRSISSIHDEEKAARFDMAISAATFGKFNYFFIVLMIPGILSVVFEITSFSYVFPIAHCDLNLTLHQKGLLNASCFIGMVTGGFFWGFLCDVLGRKSVTMVACFLDTGMVVISGLSQSFGQLFACKVLGGFFVTGVFVGLAAYLLEFCSKSHRARVQLVRGILVSTGIIIMPLLGLVVFPRAIHIQAGSVFKLRSWNIYLFICAFPSFISGIILIFLPESPRFLMMVGRNEEAMIIFRFIYSMNTGHEKEDYPIKRLVDETAETHSHGGHVTTHRTRIQALREGCQQIKPICFPPFIRYIIQISIILSCCMLSMQTIRLWLPQIFQSMSDYQYHHNTSADFCTMMSMISAPSPEPDDCPVNVSIDVYLNNIIVASTSAVMALLSIPFVNRLRKKIVLAFACFASGIFAGTIFFAWNVATVVAVSSLCLAFGIVISATLMVIIVELFPTTQRAMAIAIVMTVARISTLFGNVLFPHLLEIGCSPAFIFIGFLLIASGGNAIFLPNVDI